MGNEYTKATKNLACANVDDPYNYNVEGGSSKFNGGQDTTSKKRAT